MPAVAAVDVRRHARAERGARQEEDPDHTREVPPEGPHARTSYLGDQYTPNQLYVRPQDLLVPS